jgi:hypothetical protein
MGETIGVHSNQIFNMIIGLFLVVAVLFDVFETVVVPNLGHRHFRLTSLLVRRLLWVCWRHATIFFRTAAEKRDFLSLYAPTSIVVSLWTWLIVFLLGFAFIVMSVEHGVSPALDNLNTAFYFAGSAILTVGFGDIVPVGPAMRILVICGTICGLTIMALVTSLVFSIHSHYQSRERQILLLEGRAGIPPCGLTILENHAKKRLIISLEEFFKRSEDWFAEVVTSHVTYPFLLFFRSHSFGNSWVTSIGAVMDASLITQTIIDINLGGDSILTHRMGLRILLEVDKFYHWQAPKYDAEVEREVFHALRERLSAAGYKLIEEPLSWERFSATRAEYLPKLVSLARYMAMPVPSLLPLPEEQVEGEMLKVYSSYDRL